MLSIPFITPPMVTIGSILVELIGTLIIGSLILVFKSGEA
jgi:hypothetical protein